MAASDSDPTPRPSVPDLSAAPSQGPLFGSTVIPPGTDSTIGTFQVGCSGETILFRPIDAQGNPLAVTGLRSTDDVQVLTVVGSTTSTTMTLALGDQVTAPIPLKQGPPLTSFVWTATLPSPGTYDLSFSYRYEGSIPTGRACTNTLVEVFDGPKLVGSVVLDQSRYPDPAVDLQIPLVGIFKSLGSFALATTSLTVRLSGDAGNGPVLTGMVRVAPHGGTDPSAVGFLDSAPAGPQTYGNLAGKVSFQFFGTWIPNWVYVAGLYHGFYYAMPSGTQPTALPMQADVQAALRALPSVPAGSVTVDAPSNQSFVIRFGNALGGQAMPTLVPSEPVFRVTHDDTSGSSVGGQFPSVSINGTPHLLRAASFAVGQPVVAFHLVQDAPAVQYLRAGEATFSLSNYPPFIYNTGFGNRVAIATEVANAASCQFEGLSGPGDYELALTWPGGDSGADLLGCLIQDGQGNTLANVTGLDQSRAPGDFQDGGVGWTTVGRFHLPLQINKVAVVLSRAGAPGKHCLIDAVRLARTSPDQGVSIAPGDTVLFNAPSGFIGTSAGPMPAAQSFRVQPAATRRMPPMAPKLRTMKLGINCDPPTYYATDSVYSNYAIMAFTPIGSRQGPDGNPTRLSPDPYFPRGRSTVLLTSPPSDAGGAGWGTANCSPGTWVVQWTSNIGVQCELTPHDATTTVTEIEGSRVSGTFNRRYYKVTMRGSVAPSMMFQVLSDQKNADGDYDCDLRDLAIYPPDIDPSQPGTWRPSFLQKLQGLQCFRTMDFFSTNNLNLSSFGHFADAARFPLGMANRCITVPIATIGPPQPDAFCDGVAGTLVRVTTKVPHGLATGFSVGLRTTDGTSVGLVQGNVVDPSTGQTTSTPRDTIDGTDNYNGRYLRGMCHVIDETTFQVGLEVFYGPFARMTNTLTPATGIIYAELSPGSVIPPIDAAKLCADAGVEPWVNVPWLADDDCVTRLAQAFVVATPPGTSVHVEYGNEPWNYYFTGFHYLSKMNRLIGTGEYNAVPYYITRMGQVHQIFRDVWTKAGRDATEVRRVCGAQQAYVGGSTVPMLATAVAGGVSFDELAVASYFSNEPLQGTGDDLLSRAQVLDLMAVNVQLGGTAAQMTAHAQAVAAAAAANPQLDWLKRVELVNYEGGPDILTTQGMGANLARQNHGVHRDPDFLEIMLYWLGLLEDSGVRLFNIFTMYGIREVDQWGVYEAFQTQPGTGVAALDVANRSDTENVLAVKSETAGALRQWQALRVPSAPAARVVRAGLSAIGGRAYASTAPAA